MCAFDGLCCCDFWRFWTSSERVATPRPLAAYALPTKLARTYNADVQCSVLLFDTSLYLQPKKGNLVVSAQLVALVSQPRCRHVLVRLSCFLLNVLLDKNIQFTSTIFECFIVLFRLISVRLGRCLGKCRRAHAAQLALAQEAFGDHWDRGFRHWIWSIASGRRV